MADERQAVTLEEKPVQEHPVQIEIPPEPDIDAKVEVFFDKGSMTAEASVTAPRGNGAHINREMLDAALDKAGVLYGLDEEAINRLAESLYGERVVVATGLPPKDGENGVCTELFDHDVKRVVTKREDGTADYKELGLIRDIKEGTVICTVTLPTLGEPGTDTKGRPVKARDGIKAAVPMGENTALSEDGTRLYSTVTGNLVFRRGRFHVETVYRVENVDYDSGNITFSGDVVVKKDISDGFSINAGGTVTVHGRVGNADIRSKNLILDKGINGTGRAILEVEEELRAGFIENCTIRVGKLVVASSIINCRVECEGDVIVTTGKGVICGGKIMALGNVSAKEVGNEFSTPTYVTLGVTPKLLNERKRLKTQIVDVGRNIDELSKNAAYIEKLVTLGKQVPADRVQMLKRAKVSLPISLKKRDQLVSQLEEVEGRIADTNHVQLTANLLHPPTKVSIGSSVVSITDVKKSCRIFKSSDGEIVAGTKL